MAKVVKVGNKKFNSIAEAASYAGIPYVTFYMRIRSARKSGGLGWPTDEAMKTPVRPYASNRRKVAARRRKAA